MSPIDVAAGVQKLGQLAQEEYGGDLSMALSNVSDEMKVRRLARLTGIELKRPFATPRELPQPSRATMARREWRFKDELLRKDGSGRLPLDALAGDASYETEKRIFEELVFQGDSASGYSFGQFLVENHQESNWFLTLLRAAQPYLCEHAAVRPHTPVASAERRRFWEIVDVASTDLAQRGVEVAVTPVVFALIPLVPFLAWAPPAVAAGVSLFLVHYAKKGYCSATIQAEIIQTLKLSNNDWESK